MSEQQILLVDDDVNISRLVRLYLEKEGYSVIEAARGDTALEAFAKHTPALVLLDVMLPGLDGLQVLKEIRKTSRTPVIMLTAKDETFDKVLGLELGADDYITKPFGVMEMIARVKALLRRSGGGQESMLVCGDVTLDKEKRMVYAHGEPVDMTYKEFELLALLMKNHGIVISRDVIMERVWESNFEGESRTIDVHVRTLRQKLGEAGTLIKTVRHVGYMADASK